MLFFALLGRGVMYQSDHILKATFSFIMEARERLPVEGWFWTLNLLFRLHCCLDVAFARGLHEVLDTGSVLWGLMSVLKPSSWS